jgi:hypothetical protein
MMEFDLNFIPEEGNETKIRDLLNDIKSNAAKFLPSDGNNAFDRLNDFIQQADEQLTRIQELTQGRPRRLAGDAVLLPVDLRTSAPYHLTTSETGHKRVKISQDGSRS